jgi:hypothetical protein
MKKLTILLFCVLLLSCFDRNIELTKKESVIVDIKVGNGSLAYPHKIKVFDGSNSIWYNIREDDFNKLWVGDTLKKIRIY